MNPLIVIPARMASTRLPDKPLAMIGGVPMVVHVLNRALESDIGPVIVACDGAAIAEAVDKAGGQAVVTDPDHPSGSDRVWEAVKMFDPKGHHDVIVNLQGDVPTLEPHLLRDLLVPLKDPSVDISTLATPITDLAEIANPSVVKAVGDFTKGQGRAKDFRRNVTGSGPHYHHIGVYAYRRRALERFVALPPSPREKAEKLEQLRALEHGMRIDAMVVDTVPLGVDTLEDLEKARKRLA